MPFFNACRFPLTLLSKCSAPGQHLCSLVSALSSPKCTASTPRLSSLFKQALRDFLYEVLKLELSEEKTLITHARTHAAKFLGYHIGSQHADDKLDRRGQRQVNEMVSLRVPMEVIEQKCALYMQRGKPAQRAQLLDDSDYSIGSRVSSGVSRRRPVLSPGPKWWSVRETPMGSRNVAPQNPGRQT